jgi:hypothetical protein
MYVVPLSLFRISSQYSRDVQKDKFDTAGFELQQLLSQPSLSAVPLLVLGNKNDLEGAATVKELIRAMYVAAFTCIAGSLRTSKIGTWTKFRTAQYP